MMRLGRIPAVFDGAALTCDGVVYPLTAAQAADLSACLAYDAKAVHLKLAEGALWVHGSVLGAHSHLVGVLAAQAAPAPKVAPVVAPVPAVAPVEAPVSAPPPAVEPPVESVTPPATPARRRRHW